MSDISVVITTYNREPQIFSHAFNSVLDQTLSPKEIVVVDSGDVKEYSEEIERMVSSAVLDGTEIRYIRSERRLNGVPRRGIWVRHTVPDCSIVSWMMTMNGIPIS